MTWLSLPVIAEKHLNPWLFIHETRSKPKSKNPNHTAPNPHSKLITQNSNLFWDELFCSFQKFLTYYTDIHVLHNYFFSCFSAFRFEKQTARRVDKFKMWIIIHAVIHIRYFYFHDFLYLSLKVGYTEIEVRKLLQKMNLYAEIDLIRMNFRNAAFKN